MAFENISLLLQLVKFQHLGIIAIIQFINTNKVLAMSYYVLDAFEVF